MQHDTHYIQYICGVCNKGMWRRSLIPFASMFSVGHQDFISPYLNHYIKMKWASHFYLSHSHISTTIKENKGKKLQKFHLLKFPQRHYVKHKVNRLKTHLLTTVEENADDHILKQWKISTTSPKRWQPSRAKVEAHNINGCFKMTLTHIWRKWRCFDVEAQRLPASYKTLFLFCTVLFLLGCLDYLTKKRRRRRQQRYRRLWLQH